MKSRKMGTVLLLTAALLAVAATGPVQAAESSTEEITAESMQQGSVLEDGTYVAVFSTDHEAMFHVNEANEGKGLLTVKDGEMTIHVTLQSKRIVNLFRGTAEEAKAEDAELLEPTFDTVIYSDGMSGQAYGFDVPVPALGEEFDLALIGTHGNWYSHKVMVSDPVPGEAVPGTPETSGEETSAEGSTAGAPETGSEAAAETFAVKTAGVSGQAGPLQTAAAIGASAVLIGGAAVLFVTTKRRKDREDEEREQKEGMKRG